MKTLLLLLVLCISWRSSAQEVRKALPVYHMSLGDYQKTVEHELQLKDGRNQELQKQVDDLQAALAANSSTISTIPDLENQVKLQNAQIFHLRRENFLDRWKFSVIGVFIGLIIFIGTVYAAKLGLLGASTAAGLAKFAAKV